jgi:hypothetical protein
MESSSPHTPNDIALHPYAMDGASVYVDNGAPLPETYGDHRLTIMARDPSTIFTYWEIAPWGFDELRARFGSALDHAEQILRVFDVSDIPDGDLSHAPYFDFPVHHSAMQCYVTIPRPGRRHLFELGFRLSDGTFASLLRSNIVLLPHGRVSDQLDAQWMAVRAEYEAWEKIFQTTDIGRGSAEFSRQMAQRWQFLKSIFSWPVPPSSMMQMPSSMPSSMPTSLPGSRSHTHE